MSNKKEKEIEKENKIIIIKRNKHKQKERKKESTGPSPCPPRPSATKGCFVTEATHNIGGCIPRPRESSALSKINSRELSLPIKLLSSNFHRKMF
jgi:hypothetical protein